MCACVVQEACYINHTFQIIAVEDVDTLDGQLLGRAPLFHARSMGGSKFAYCHAVAGPCKLCKTPDVTFSYFAVVGVSLRLFGMTCAS
eukprot:5276738-Amphidinium_carterae.1